MATHFKGPVVSANGFQAGTSGASVKALNTGTVSINPASVATGAVTETTVTLAGVAVGDVVMFIPAAAGITAGLMVGDVRITAADTVKVRIANLSGSTVDEAAANWTYLWFDLT